MGNPKFNKKLGQHILKNIGIIDTIIEKAKIKSGDTILEIGGGTGNLTLKLLPRCKKVICYEKDPRLASELIKKVEHANLTHKLELFVGDVLKHDFPPFDLCISNIPYQISSPIVFKLLKHKFRKAFIMFQREFANRMVAKVGDSDYCRLSVSVQMLAKVNLVMKISRNSFVPPPNVDSSFVYIEPREVPGIDFAEFDRFLKTCFLRKNKTINSVFDKTTLKRLIDKNKIVEQENKLNTIKEVVSGFQNDRANKMTIERFLELIIAFKKIGINF